VSGAICSLSFLGELYFYFMIFKINDLFSVWFLDGTIGKPFGFIVLALMSVSLLFCILS
jgi:hypothetical protein